MTGISDMSDEITENARVIENAQPAENIQSVKKAADNSGLYSGGVFRAGEKVQLTDRRLKKVTVQLVPGGLTSTEHGNIVHDDIIGKPEGTVTTTVSAKKKDSKTDSRKPWKNSTQTGGWQYSAMRPRLVDERNQPFPVRELDLLLAEVQFELQQGSHLHEFTPEKGELI